MFGACIIRNVGRYYYVYEATSKWNKTTGKPQKKTGHCLGKIEEADGFIPNKYALSLMAAKGVGAVPESYTEVNYGAYEMLQQLSPEMTVDLREFFPHRFREIRTLALLNLVDGAGPQLVRPIFMESYMKDLCPDLALSEDTVHRFVSWLGTQQNAQEAFMRKFVDPGRKLLFDGTTMFANFQDALSQRGYNPGRRTRHQIRLLYIFDEESWRPVFYRVFPGNAVDKTSFLEVLQAAGCSHCIVIADNGFYSKANISVLMNSPLKIEYLLPLQHNTSLVSQTFYESRDPAKFDEAFAYGDRMVYGARRRLGDKGNFVYTFYDPRRQSREQANFLNRSGSESLTPHAALADSRGYFSLISNIDDTSEAIYLTYKERANIEQCYDFLKNTMHAGAAYAHSDNALRGWAFLNHVALLYFYGLIRALHRAHLDQQWAPASVIMLAKNVRARRYTDGNFRVPHIQEKTLSIFRQIGIRIQIASDPLSP